MQWLTTHPMQQLIQTLKMVPQFDQKNMQIFNNSKNIFFHGIFAPFFLVSMCLYGPKHFSGTLFFVMGGPTKNVHKITATIDQK